MDRTTGADNIDIGGGRRGFRSQNLEAGLFGTEVNGDWCNMVQEEIMAVIEDPTLVPPIAPDEDVWTQMRDAIRRHIDSVRVLLPIFPEVLTVDGKFSVSSPAPGTVRIGAGTEWVQRGGTKRVTVQKDLPTAVSKLYHLRWVNGDFALFDLASLTYNPLTLAETDKAFDSTYDDVLVARVSTSAGNVATMLPLINKVRLKLQTERRDTLAPILNWGPFAGSSTVLDWARTPDTVFFALNEIRSNQIGPDGTATAGGAGKILAVGMRVPAAGRSRYGLPDLDYYYEDDALNQGLASATLLVEAP